MAGQVSGEQYLRTLEREALRDRLLKSILEALKTSAASAASAAPVVNVQVPEATAPVVNVAAPVIPPSPVTPVVSWRFDVTRNADGNIESLLATPIKGKP